MTQFATHDDFAARLGLTLTTDEQTRADALLQSASGLIQEVAKQQIALVTDDVLTMPGRNDERITLPERPVVSVRSVTINGDALEQGTDWYLDGDELVRMRATVLTSAGVDAMLDWSTNRFYGFGWPNQTLEITYTHGYAANAIPATVKAICMEAAVRVWVNPGSVARETEGNTSVVYDNMRFSPTGLLLTTDERRAIRKFFGIQARSIQIGS